MLVTAVLRIGYVIAIAMGGILVFISSASATLLDTTLRKSRHSSLGGGGSQVILTVGEQQTGPERYLAPSSMTDTLHDCTASGLSDEDTVEAFDNMTTLSLGSQVASLLTGRRRAGGEEGTWYEDKLATLLIEYCEEEQQSIHHR